MINRLSIRIRLVFITVAILIFCCIGLTFIINYYASQMAVSVAHEVVPANVVNTDEQQKESSMSAYGISDTFDDSEIQQEIIDRFYRNSYAYMLIMIGMGGMLMYVFSKRILFPLTKLNEKIRNSSVCNLSEKIVVPDTKDEIAELSLSFNKMTDRIQEAFLFQQQFSANVAHELRTPLTILKTKIEVFHKKERAIAEYDQLITDLQHQVTRLSDIVEILLELTGTDEIREKEYISAADLIDNVLLELLDLAAQREISISTDLQDVEVFGNLDLLYQVFYNLIQNSIKYNVEKGSIFISALCDSDQTIIKICDSGIGITPKLKQRVFEPFFRIDSSRARLMGGAGLGLSIVKNIMDKHNGTIIITDNVPQGTCFTLALPLPTKQ